MPRRVFTSDVVVKALQETHGFSALAAVKLGCNVRTIERYVAKSPKAQEELRHQRELMLDITEGKLFRAIQNDEAWAICFYLKTQGRLRGYSQRVELTDGEGNALQAAPQIVVVSSQAEVLTQQIVNGERTALLPGGQN